QGFLLQRRQKNDLCLGGRQRIEKCVQPGNETRQAGRAVERLVGAVTDYDHRRLQGQYVLFEMAEAVRGGAETSLRLAEDVVTTPAEIAKTNGLPRKASRQRGLPIAVALLALDQGTADQDNAIAVLQLQGRRFRSRQAEKTREKQRIHRSTPADRV